MEPLNPTRPEELTAALMENELLRYEVRHLRARLHTAQGDLPPVLEDVGDRQGSSPAPAPGDPRGEQALADVLWLVGRLDRSVLGPVLRRWQGFRTLRSRYLTDSGA